MSWSHSKTGTPSELLSSLDGPRKMNCVEPEHGFKNDALELISRMLGSYPEDVRLDLACYGSQSGNGDAKPVNTISISLKPSPKD